MLGSHGFTCCLDTPGWTWTNPEKPEKTGQDNPTPQQLCPGEGAAGEAPGAAMLPSLHPPQAPSSATPPCAITAKLLLLAPMETKMRDNFGSCSRPPWKGSIWAKSNCTGSASGYCLFPSPSHTNIPL